MNEYLNINDCFQEGFSDTLKEIVLFGLTKFPLINLNYYYLLFYIQIFIQDMPFKNEYNIYKIYIQYISLFSHGSCEPIVSVFN